MILPNLALKQCNKINKLLLRQTIPENHLILTVSNTYIAEYIDNFSTTINKYKDMGVLTAVIFPNFESVNLKIIQNVPLDYIIINRVVAAEDLSDGNSLIIASGIISICRNMNIKIIISGVDSEKEYNIIKDINIDFIQGNYLNGIIDVNKVSMKLKSENK